jgi:hypothetical protein
MRKIDGINYISAKEYAEMMNLTVGRVSQIKTELPFVKFEEFGIELINFDLLTLSQTEKTLAQAKFQTATPIHELSYKDLGNYFGKFIMDLVTFKGLADSQISDLQEKTTDLRQKSEIVENEKATLLNELSKVTTEKDALNTILDNERQINENLKVALLEEETTNETLCLQSDLLSMELQHLKTLQKEEKHALEIKSIENKNLLAENENLKARIAAMELATKNEADFKEEFKQLKELVMKKIK